MPDPFDDAPPVLVAQIARHWETHLPQMSRDLKAAGTFETSVREPALMTSDAEYDRITKH
jgi:hypothetical protein